MLIPLTVTLSLFVQVCTAALYDVAFARLTSNQAVVGSYSELLCNTIFSNGDVLVSGYTKGLVGYNSAGSADFLLQRYSETGTLLWTKVFGGLGFDSIESVSLDSTDNIYATGYTSSSSASQDVYIGKFDSSGNTIYSKTIGGTAGEQGLSIFVDKARGVFFVSGYTQSLTFYDVARTGTTDAFLLKLDSATGAVIKNTQNGAAGSATTFLALTVDSTGAPWISGRTNAPSYFSQTAYGNNDIVIQKFSSDGVSQVVHRIGGNSNDFSTGMATDTNDNVYTSGWASTAIEGQTSNGGLDIFVTKCNSAGTKLWTKLLGSAGTDSSLGMTVDSAQGLIYITGYLQTASFYGAATSGSTILSSYLLVLSSSDGSYVTSTVYGPESSQGINLAVQGTRLYMTGNAGQVFQGQNSSSIGGTGFVMRLETSDVLPIATPSASPTTHPSGAPTTSAPTPVPSTFEPTASPTAVCMQWALGDYGESCSATCSKLSRTCKDKYLKEIVNQESFYAIVGSAVSVRSGGAVGTAETFCSQTTDSAVKVGGPAALSIVLSSEDRHLPVRTSCTYPTSTADATLGCDAVLPLHNYRRFCPCVDHNCDGAWYLGYSGDSCDATCTSAGGVCDAEPLNDIVNPDAFSAMVASATVVETNEIIGESSAAYCHEGINILPLAPAPSVITLTFGSTNETLCAYPTSVSNLQGSCDMAFTDLPAQRFCNCKVTGPASHPHRMLLAAEAAEPAAVQPKIAMAVPTPRLRGKAF